jgi:hypothetical protein
MVGGMRSVSGLYQQARSRFSGRSAPSARAASASAQAASAPDREAPVRRRRGRRRRRTRQEPEEEEEEEARVETQQQEEQGEERRRRRRWRHSRRTRILGEIHRAAVPRLVPVPPQVPARLLPACRVCTCEVQLLYLADRYL